MLFVPDTDRLFERLMIDVVEKCEKCRGSGRIVVDKDEIDIKSVMCSCFQRVNEEVGRIEGNIPEEFWTADQKQTEASDFVSDYTSRLAKARRLGDGAIFYGDLGRGKTTSACTILLKALRAGYGVGYFTAADFLESLIPAGDDEGLREYRTQLSRADFLVIDEFGNEYRKKGSEFAVTQLESLLRWRRSYSKPTILCVNFANVREFKEAMGPAIWSLLGGRTKSFSFTGGDLRRG